MLSDPLSVCQQSLYALASEYGNALSHPLFKYENIHSNLLDSVKGSLPLKFNNNLYSYYSRLVFTI